MPLPVDKQIQAQMAATIAAGFIAELYVSNDPRCLDHETLANHAVEIARLIFAKIEAA